MLRFELLKIFKNKVNLAAMVLGYILVAFVFFSHISSASVYDPSTDREITGRSAFQASREIAAAQGDTLNEGTIEKTLKEIREYPGDLNSDDAYMDIVRKNGALFYYLVNSYDEISDFYPDNNILKEIDLTAGTGFYEWRLEKVSEYLNRNFSFGDYTKAEKEYWLNKAAQVEEPFAWGSKAAMNIIADIISLGFYLLAVILICLSPVFSRESETGAVQFLFTTKNGKTRLIRAKVLASLLFCISYLTIGVGLGCLAVIIYCGGLPETSLPVQLWANHIPYNVTIGQAMVMNFLLILLIAVMVTMILLLISAWTRSTLAAMSAVLVLIIGPAFLSGSKTSALYNHIIELAVVRQINILTEMERFISYRFGPVILDCLTMDGIVYPLICILCMAVIRKIYVRGNIAR